jgi:pyrrolysine biosynthesis protein PylD
MVARLSYSIVKEIGNELESYDKELERKTGHTLKQIAYHGTGLLKIKPSGGYKTSVAVIPVSSGQGIIEGFTVAVRDIIEYLGFTSLITSKTDVAGLAQAIEKKTDVVFLADDNCFVAINLERRYVSDNAVATAGGYIAALDYLAGGLRDKMVLVVGAGKVGKAAAEILKEMGAKIAIYDSDSSKAVNVAPRYGAKVERSLDEALHNYTTILEASPAADIIRAEHIKPETKIAACGIPIGTTKEARSILGDRLIHDPLQIGVATMMMACACL